MSTKKKKTIKKEKSKSSLVSFIKFLRSERGRFLLGVCLVFIAIYILIGMISFFFTGAEDQSKVINKSLWDLIIHRQDIKNWTGVGGAFIAETLINKYLGIFTLILPIMIAIWGAKLMGLKMPSLLKSSFVCCFILIWGSLFSALVLNKLFPNSHVVWGGSHGSVIEYLLVNSIGTVGLILVLVMLLAIFIFATKSHAIGSFQSLFKGNSTIIEDDVYDTDMRDNSISKAKKNIFQQLSNRFKYLFFRSKRKDIKEAKIDVDSKGKDQKEQLYTSKSDLREESKYEVNNNKKQNVKLDDDFEIVVPKEEDIYIDYKADQIKKESQTSVLDENLDANLAEELEEYDPTKDLSNFSFPSPGLLKMYDTSGREVDMEEQKANKTKIINTLGNYGIEITSIKATVGPTITLYEIVPQAGVRISKIKNLEDDIALSLSALGIRIIAPMPGKGTIGIEVPNKDPQIVSMQSVIASQRFQECNYDLPVALGKTITNDIFMFDLCKMPHLLVAGATGQGKSVGLNAIITSLLYKKHPAEMKMVLVDPKMVEFNIYSTIEKHYLAKLPDSDKAIITDVSKVTQTLNSLTKEMDDRYELLMGANVRNIKEYNEKFRKRRLNPLKGHRFLPYIVVIIDEFGDLIMTAGKEIEMPIARIAQKARAVGIHMIIATQRPTTNIITGTIKANFPARMAFRVTSQIDSRTILDMSGANQLIGRGDMLFSQGSDLVRIQCAFVDTPEVEEITQYIGHQQGYSHAFELPEYVGDTSSSDKVGTVDLNDRDSLFEEAARLIVIHQQGSTSLIQRKFSIGYNRAGRIMDQLEAAGIVGPTQGSKPREVLIMDEYSLEQKITSV